MIQILDYKESHYDSVCKMWESNGLVCPPRGVLGDSGVICFEGGAPLCAIFIFNPTSEMGMMEFMVSNKNANKDIRGQAIDLMLQSAVEKCKEIGYIYIYTATSSAKFIDRLERVGLKKHGTPQQHMFWGV